MAFCNNKKSVMRGNLRLFLGPDTNVVRVRLVGDSESLYESALNAGPLMLTRWVSLGCWLFLWLPIEAVLWQNSTTWIGTSNQTLSCPPGMFIVAAFSYSQNPQVDTPCSAQARGACIFGAPNCTVYGCDGEYASIWIACDVDAFANGRTFVSAIGTSSATTVTCSTGNIAFGTRLQYTAYTDDSCLLDNNVPCAVGPTQKQCSSSDCNQDARDNNQYVWAMCESGSPYRMAYNIYYDPPSSGITASCKSGYQIAFGYRYKFGTWTGGISSSKANCIYASHGLCTAGLSSCDNSGCSLTNYYATYYDLSAVILACEGVKCGSPPVRSGTMTCTAGFDGSAYSYGTNCSLSCSTGLALNSTDSKTSCSSSGTWDSLGDCVDVNECLKANGGCDNRTQCINYYGYNGCTDCPAPYTGNGGDPGGCQFQNLCAGSPCPAGTQCYMLLANFTCSPTFVPNSLQVVSGATLVGNVIQATSLNGSVVSVMVQLGGPVTSLSLSYGPPISGDEQIYTCGMPTSATNPSPSPLYPVNLVLPCTMQSGLGWNLSFTLNWCLTTNKGVVCGLSTPQGSMQKFQYPSPVISSNTIRFPDTAPSTNILSELIVDEIIFSGGNFLYDSSKFTVMYGPSYTCGLLPTTNSTTIHCLSQQGNVGVFFTFRILVFDGDVGGPTVYGTDRYTPNSTGLVLVNSVSVDGIANTSGCPTDGDVDVTINGMYFNVKPMSVLIEGTTCLVDPSSVQQQTSGVATLKCTLGPGVGQGLAVIVQAGISTSLPYIGLSFALPSTISITGCTSQSSLVTVNCPRAGGVGLTVKGSNFGALGARILLGATLCINTTHDSTSPHNILYCVLPPGGMTNIVIRAQQSSGGMSSVLSTQPSASDLLLSYAQCTPGTYSVNQGPCLACPYGRYSDFSGASMCTLCPVGLWNGQTGASACLSCSLGWFRDNNQVNALVNAEVAFPLDYPMRLNLSYCQPCSLGTYGDPEQRVRCLLCPMGEYGNFLGSTGCDPCPAGTYGPSLGSISCTNCPAGTVSQLQGSYQCQPCPPGLYIEEEGGASCLPCPIGSAQGDQGGSSCALCVPGTYQGLEGQYSCNRCEKGTHQPGNGTSACQQCNPGTYQSAQAALTCIACSPGNYQDQYGASNCQPCPLGRASNDTGITACEICAPGRWQGNTGETDCMDCSPGFYTGASESHACTPCAPGAYGDKTAAVECIPCEPGRAINTFGFTACSTCKAGSFAPNNRTQLCEPCDAGKFSLNGQSSCTLCSVGKFQQAEESQVCVTCSPGYFAATNGSAKCDACSGGSAYAASVGMSTCLSCTDGAVANSQKTGCLCPVGTYANGEACLPCPAGAKCVATGVARATLAALPGYWRAENGPEYINGTNITDNRDLVFYPCLRPLDCRGGVNSTCANFRTGLLCGNCLPGYKTSFNTCTKCPAQKTAMVYGAFLSLGAVLGLTLMYVIVVRSEHHRLSSGKATANFEVRSVRKRFGIKEDGDEEEDPSSSITGRKAPVSRLTSATVGNGNDDPPSFLSIRPGNAGLSAGLSGSTRGLYLSNHPSIDLVRNKTQFAPNTAQRPIEYQILEARARVNMTFPLKMLLSFFQIATTLCGISSLPWPDYYLRFMAVFSFLGMELIPWQSLSCSVSGFNFYTRVMVITATPPVAFILLFFFFFLPTLISDRFDYSDDDTRRNSRRRHRALFWKLVCFTLFLIYPLVSNTLFAVYKCVTVAGASYLVRDFTVICYTKTWTKYAIFAGVMILVYPIGVPITFLFLLFNKRKVLFTDIYTKTSLGFFYESYVQSMWWFEALDMAHKLLLTSVLQFLPSAGQLRFGLAVTGSYVIITMVVSPYVRRSDDRLFMAAKALLMNLMLASFAMQTLSLTALNQVLLALVLIFMVVALMLFVFAQLIIFIRKLVRLQARLKKVKEKGRATTGGSMAESSPKSAAVNLYRPQGFTAESKENH